MPLIALGLLIGLDNCLVGAALGPLQLDPRRRRRLALSFGLFEMLMPLIGAAVAARGLSATGWQLEGLTPMALAVCALLALIGARRRGRVALQGRLALILVPLSLSLDNLAAGATLLQDGGALLSSALMIGALSGLLSLLGLSLGAHAATWLAAPSKPVENEQHDTGWGSKQGTRRRLSASILSGTLLALASLTSLALG